MILCEGYKKRCQEKQRTRRGGGRGRSRVREGEARGGRERGTEREGRGEREHLIFFTLHRFPFCDAVESELLSVWLGKNDQNAGLGTMKAMDLIVQKLQLEEGSMRREREGGERSTCWKENLPLAKFCP
jgi:hypothetical protein